MGGISYDGYQITPAPFLSLNKSYDEAGGGERIGSTWNIILEGKFLPNKGSPDGSGILYATGISPPDFEAGTQDYMTALLRKQEGLRNLFSQEGKELYIQGWNSPIIPISGTNNIAIFCNPRIKAPIEFPKGGPTSWASIADYRITLEADIIYGSSGIFEDSSNLGSYHVSQADENWAIEVQDADTQVYRLTHEVNAKGKRFFSTSGTLDKKEWERARDYCLDRLQLGIDTQFMYATGVLNNNNLSAYNYVRTQRVGEKAGTFSASETWLAYFAGVSGIPAIDTFDVDTHIDMNGYTKVGLKGKIEGLEVRNPTTMVLASGKYFNAHAKYWDIVNSFLSRASGYANVTLNPTPLAKTIGTNPITGVITYNYEYDNRPLNSITDAVSENISVRFDYSSDVFASLPVLGRAAGPVLQSIQTITSKKKGIIVEAVMPAKTMTYTPTKPDTNALISGYAPSATWVFKDQDSENYDANQGRYSRQVSWVYNN